MNILLIIDFYYYKGNTLNYILVPIYSICIHYVRPFLLLRDHSSHAKATLLGPGLFSLCTNSAGTVSSFTSRLSPNPNNLCSRSMVTWCWQTIFRFKLNFSTVWPAISSPTRMEFIGIWKNLSFHGPFSCSVFLLLDIQTFYYHKTRKKNSNYVAVLVFKCCAAPISLRVVDSLCHTHAFSRVILREFLLKWATMAAPMVSENVRFKINFMMYNIVTKFKKSTYVTIFYLEWYVGIGRILTHFQHYGCMFL